MKIIERRIYHSDDWEWKMDSNNEEYYYNSQTEDKIFITD